MNRCLLELDENYFGYDFRDKRFDRSVQHAISDRVKLDGDKIVLLTNRFEAKLLKHYANTIAQTEMLSALNQSEWLSIKKASENSDLPSSATTRIWKTACDDKVRPSHQALHGQRVVGFDKCFVSPLTGVRMMFPGDTSLGASEDEIRSCRCRVQYDTDFLFGVL